MFKQNCDKTGKGLMTTGKGCPGDTNHRPQGDDDDANIHLTEKRRLGALVQMVKQDKDGSMFMNIRQNDNKEFFDTFVNICLVHLTSVSEWRSKMYSNVIKDIFTVSDEAFAMLLFENHVDDFASMIADAEESTDVLEIQSRKFLNPRFTKTEGEKKDVRRVGWNKQGIKRFNQIIKHLEQVRRQNVSMEREKEIKAMYAELCGITTNGFGENGEGCDGAESEGEDSIDAFDGFAGDDDEVAEDNLSNTQHIDIVMEGLNNVTETAGV